MEGSAAAAAAAALTAKFHEHASDVVHALWSLQDALMFKFADGMISTVSPSGSLHVGTEAYPDWWLKDVGYEDGPPPVPPGSVVYA